MSYGCFVAGVRHVAHVGSERHRRDLRYWFPKDFDNFCAAAVFLDTHIQV